MFCDTPILINGRNNSHGKSTHPFVPSLDKRGDAEPPKGEVSFLAIFEK
jgi:hypothetical protein